MYPDRELALRAGEDVRAAALRLGRAHEKFVSLHSMPSFVRSVIADSWERCVAAGASQDGRRLPPIRMDADELDDYRARHPLAAAMPVFRELLGERASDDEHIFAVADADGILLWVQGHSGTLDRAGRMNFVEGAEWSRRGRDERAGHRAGGQASRPDLCRRALQHGGAPVVLLGRPDPGPGQRTGARHRRHHR